VDEPLSGLSCATQGGSTATVDPAAEIGTQNTGSAPWHRCAQIRPGLNWISPWLD
jgi:hypothetical protein